MPLKGAVDGVLGRFVVGWVHDTRENERRVELELELDGELVGTATADLERGDLVVAGIGDGCHAFRFELARGFEPGSEHQLTVRTRPEGLPLPLANDFVVEFDAVPSGQEPIVSPPADPIVSSPADPNVSPPADPIASVPPDPVAEDAGPEHDAQPRDAGPPRALLGVQGWLYELGDQLTLDWLLGRRPIPAARIEDARQRLLERHRRLAELGTLYVVAALPAKVTLYPEHLPPELEPSPHERAASLLAGSLRDFNGIELLDLLPALRDARRHGELMPPGGSELTWTGAFHAYRALAKELAKRWPSIQPQPIEALGLGAPVPVAASLAAHPRVALVGGEEVPVAIDSEPAPTELELVSGELRATFVPIPHPLEEQLGPGACRLESAESQVPRTAIVVHRGAGGRVASLLAEHFAQTLVAASGEVPYEAARTEEAAVVVELIDEAGLCARSVGAGLAARS